MPIISSVVIAGSTNHSNEWGRCLGWETRDVISIISTTDLSPDLIKIASEAPIWRARLRRNGSTNHIPSLIRRATPLFSAISTRLFAHRSSPPILSNGRRLHDRRSPLPILDMCLDVRVLQLLQGLMLKPSIDTGSDRLPSQCNEARCQCRAVWRQVRKPITGCSDWRPEYLAPRW